MNLKKTETSEEDILRLIPHRPPFLWVDRIIGQEADAIETEKTIPAELDIFKGHYPDYPIMPGVLLCEAAFQSGALLMAMGSQDSKKEANKLPVLARIQEAKFKREVKPGDTIRIKVKVVEREGSAVFFKGRVMVSGKTAVKVKFICTLADKESEG
jgi:3-hydroxyacyl-[acyl-carrier-protein] dehydratase